MYHSAFTLADLILFRDAFCYGRMYIHENSVSQDLINSMNVKSLKFSPTPTFCGHSRFWKIASANVFYPFSNGNNKMFFKAFPLYI